MANKNKKIKRLVQAATSSKPDRLEIIPTLTQPVFGPAAANEVSESTIDVDHNDLDLKDKSKSQLRDLLKGRARLIEELRFQLEHALARRRGLEKELQVREEITHSVNEEVRGARQQMQAAARELELIGNEYAALKQSFADTDVLATELGAETARFKTDADKKDQRIADLEEQLRRSKSELSDLRTYVDGRKQRWEQHQLALAEVTGQLESSRAECGRLNEDLATRAKELKAANRALADTRSSLDATQTDIERLREENQALKDTLQEDSAEETRLVRDRLAIQSGELAARAQELEALRKDNERFEAYANSLRIRLQDEVAAGRESAGMQQKLEASLETAGNMINDLSAQLSESRATTQKLMEEKHLQQEVYEREIRQVRFELTGAQQTISDQESVNEQLASDLIDNQGFRQALELHLGETEKENEKTIQKLRKELEKAGEKTSEYERKLRIKDGAIADLMKELAGHTSTLELRSDLENALKKIDGRKRHEQPVRRKGERDHRVARMLIGNADGRELRFPLFKNRLTIGRTPHNDIQLDLRFISRRHAVIATDHNKTRIIDWGSRNGVYVNKQRITEKILKSGDVITIGLTNLRFEERTKR